MPGPRAPTGGPPTRAPGIGGSPGRDTPPDDDDCLLHRVDPGKASHTLRGNIARNCVETECLAIESAVGDEEGPVEIQVEGDLREGQGSGTANIVADDSDYACERIPLQLTTLDALAASSALPTGCSVVKIDTDGYDLKVLQGGRGFVGTERPVVFGEFLAHCMRWHHQGLAEVVSQRDSLGYAVWQRLPGGWSFTRGVDERIYEQDLLLVPREKEGRFEWCLSGREVGR
ncbi:MAG: hypothetical protein EDX89_23705 [Acidobacteria bacterium]|nr:MAG: hypothetical protein EDX89_23705 [Acidobacteriota bacterium]MCE7956737.1 hypothetical protein [Acidobacteria bacterium ACB2]